MTRALLQVGQAPSELALNSAGFTPLAFANAVRIGSSNPVYVAGLLRREPRIAPWSTDTTPAPAQQQVVHALDVVGVQADRRLVEDVGDVGERRPEVADHLRALRLTARQRARRPVQGKVAKPDLHERV